MRILAIADRPPSQSISEILRAHPVDVIVTLGDLEFHQIRALADITTVPKLGIYGNHCSGMYMDPLGIENLHLRTRTVSGVTFGGFEGCVRYKPSPTAKMHTQEEATALLAAFPHVDIMLVHCPPFGVNDEPEDITHQGFHALRTYAETQKPTYLFHGHTYPSADRLVTRLAETEIVYVFGEKLVEVEIPSSPR